MLRKPQTCAGCALETKGTGWAPAVGPAEAGLLLVGEAIGRQEAFKGEPFVGPAGEMLNRILRRVGIDRAGVRIDNLVRCQPPNDWLVGSPWEYPAVARCRQYLWATLREPHRAIVAIGPAPTRHLLGLPAKKHKQENWHGCPTQDADGRWVIPTFHPSFILRGNQKLIGTVAYDLQVALQVAQGKWARQEAELVVDPEADWFRAWAREHAKAVLAAPETTWLAVDIETARKLGADEGDLEDVAADDIVRINFSNHPDLGITVPWAGQYLDIIRDLLALPGVKCFWNARFDVPRLRAAGCQLGGHQLDFMWAWHVLQSNLPRGLGFVAPFYSGYGAWKHLSGSDPGLYAAIDAVQTIRCAFGIARDLRAGGQWDTFWRHVYQLDTRVLHPAEQIGLLVDQEKLGEFQKDLRQESDRLRLELQGCVPEEIRPKKVWKREPDLAEKAVQHLRRELVQGCTACGALEIAKTHRCPDRSLSPQVSLVEAVVPRWIRIEPFNPASPDQLLDYILWKGLKGGKAKKSKTGKPSTDKKTLEALAKSSKDPFFRLVLDFRAVEKVRGTYVEGTIERLKGGDGRLHAQFLHVPSTMRLSCVRPNLQNITTDRGLEKASIASGFRRCLVAAPGCRLIEVDYCVDPATKILKTDLTWAKAEELGQGEELIAFSEDGTHFESSTVLATRRIRRHKVRVVTTEGETVVSYNHPFLCRYDGYGRRWITAQDLKPGVYITYLAKPWEIDESREAGYLAGFFDGEGWLSKTKVGYGQNPGPTLDYVKRLLQEKGLKFSNAGSSNRNIKLENSDGLRQALRFIGSIRPGRLLPKARTLWEGRRTWGKRTPRAKVLSVELLPIGDVIAIETTTKTYISDGFFSHNSGIEAVETGWFSGDPQYIRLAKLGVHAYLSSHDLKNQGKIKEAADLRWSDADLNAFFQELKSRFKPDYERAKRCVHGTNYGLTTIGMVNNFPETFTRQSAEKLQRLYFDICPKLAAWQRDTQARAAKQGYLGGGDHPFRYKHWFWLVYQWNARTQTWSLGDDAKRCVAYYPQSTAAGVVKEAALCLLDQGDPDYIGDLYWGRTPLRALVHDSILVEVPDQAVDRATESIVRVMERGIRQQKMDPAWGMGEFLQIGAVPKVGKDWLKMEEIRPGTLASDVIREVEEEPEEVV